ncbi:hypothetical protein QJS10_CPB13g01149 [Acorus calamus]|uniref:Uncharacterized protein n=1 Tax=Acorus calamus TaxID=4465 RepID=A0AAV9DGN9_ACOCL|nr:hypothetical protein QJS10_CPB13g01149 [Acorus calamus]
MQAETLAKKYEKYKQVGDVASKLTVEEATFCDVQVRADRIQSDLEELVKALNERCKRHGLSVKPMAVIELPFGAGEGWLVLTSRLLWGGYFLVAAPIMTCQTSHL